MILSESTSATIIDALETEAQNIQDLLGSDTLSPDSREVLQDSLRDNESAQDEFRALIGSV